MFTENEIPQREGGGEHIVRMRTAALQTGLPHLWSSGAASGRPIGKGEVVADVHLEASEGTEYISKQLVPNSNDRQLSDGLQICTPTTATVPYGRIDGVVEMGHSNGFSQCVEEENQRQLSESPPYENNFEISERNEHEVEAQHANASIVWDFSQNTVTQNQGSGNLIHNSNIEVCVWKQSDECAIKQVRLDVERLEQRLEEELKRLQKRIGEGEKQLMCYQEGRWQRLQLEKSRQCKEDDEHIRNLEDQCRLQQDTKRDMDIILLLFI